jgi:hypothetical protein
MWRGLQQQKAIKGGEDAHRDSDGVDGGAKRVLDAAAPTASAAGGDHAS